MEGALVPEVSDVVRRAVKGSGGGKPSDDSERGGWEVGHGDREYLCVRAKAFVRRNAYGRLSA